MNSDEATLNNGERTPNSSRPIGWWLPLIPWAGGAGGILVGLTFPMFSYMPLLGIRHTDGGSHRLLSGFQGGAEPAAGFAVTVLAFAVVWAVTQNRHESLTFGAVVGALLAAGCVVVSFIHKSNVTGATFTPQLGFWVTTASGLVSAFGAVWGAFLHAPLDSQLRQ